MRPALIAAVLGVTAVAALGAQQVTFDRIQHPEKEPQNWLSYSENLFNQRFSPLTQITPANAKNLELQWVWQSKPLAKFEATPPLLAALPYPLHHPPLHTDSD